MSRAASEELIRHFFEAFNAADVHAMLACLSEDVVLDPNQQSRLIGLERFRWHLAERARHFDERAEDLAVMCDEAGLRAAAEYTLRGTYRSSAEGLPAATGQRYAISAGSFFEIDDDRLIARVSSFFSLPALTEQLARR